MIDNHGRSRPAVAIKQIEAIEEFNVLFFEEPVPVENLDSFELVRRAGLRTEIATGERLYFRWGFKDLIARRLVDVIQPDICHGGGISELRRIAAAAETEHITLAPHNPNGPVSCVASVQLCAAAPNFLILETSRAMPWHEKVQKNRSGSSTATTSCLPSRASASILDEDVIASRPMKTDRPYVGAWNADDNSVADV